MNDLRSMFCPDEIVEEACILQCARCRFFFFNLMMAAWKNAFSHHCGVEAQDYSFVLGNGTNLFAHACTFSS